MDSLDFLTGLFAFFLFLLAGFPILAATRHHRRSFREQARLFAAAMAVRFALSLGLYGLGLVALIGDDDSSGWYGGVVRVQEWEEGGVGLVELPYVLLGAFNGTNRGYSYLIGAFFFLTNAPYRLPVAALSCFCGALTVVFIFRIAERLFSPWVASRAGWWSCLIPSLVIWSCQTVKEPIVILLETVLAYVCLRFRLRKFAVRYGVACVVCIGCLTTLRFYAAYVGFVMVGFSLLVPRFRDSRLTRRVAFQAALFVIPLTGVTAAILQRELAAQKFDLDRVSQLKDGLARTANTGVVSNYDLSTPSGFVGATIVGAVHLLLAPFPWQWGGGSTRLMLTLPETILWWGLFFGGVVPGFRLALRERFGEIIPLLVLLIGLGFLYSVTFGNVGLVYRQRAQLLPSLLIFAMVGFEQRARRRASVPSTRISQQPWPAVGLTLEPKPAAVAPPWAHHHPGSEGSSGPGPGLAPPRDRHGPTGPPTLNRSTP